MIMLNKFIIQEIIDTWLNDIRRKNVVQRDELRLLKKNLHYKQVIAVSGVRRAGKTYMLFQLVQELLLSNPESVCYINFEDERFSNDVAQLDLIYRTFLEYKDAGEKLYFFFDEIQNISGWEKWLARMYEKEIKFFVSGSNALLLSTEFSQSLTGRHKIVQVFPLSFAQYVQYKRSELLLVSQKVVENIAVFRRLLSDYLRWGGFPEVVYEDNRDLLKDFFRDIVTRDVIARQNIRYKQSLREIALILLTNIGRYHSLYSLNKTLQSRSINTVKNYLAYLEDAYLLLKIPFLSFSVKKQQANPFKIFAIDNGLRNEVSFRFSEDVGWLYENTAAIELVRRYGKESVYYWKAGRAGEVDFVVREGRKIMLLIQVCFNYNDDTKLRELKGLIAGSQQLACDNLLLLCAETEGQETVNGRKVEIKPLWKWLIER